ncbi:MAG: hypothetical protein AB7K52_08190 [Phycisphaerales bacterium]
MPNNPELDRSQRHVSDQSARCFAPKEPTRARTTSDRFGKGLFVGGLMGVGASTAAFLGLLVLSAAAEPHGFSGTSLGSLIAWKPAMPVEVSFRQAELGPGLVARLSNASDRHLSVILKQFNPTLKSHTTARLDLKPRHTSEVGWAEGVTWASGDVLTIEHAEYASKSAKLP